MRYTAVSLLIATFAALACFVLVPIIGLFVLSVLHPGLFDDDAFGWASPFLAIVFLPLLLSLSVAIGALAFFFVKARLSNRN